MNDAEQQLAPWMCRRGVHRWTTTTTEPGVFEQSCRRCPKRRLMMVIGFASGGQAKGNPSREGEYGRLDTGSDGLPVRDAVRIDSVAVAPSMTCERAGCERAAFFHAAYGGFLCRAHAARGEAAEEGAR